VKGSRSGSRNGSVEEKQGERKERRVADMVQKANQISKGEPEGGPSTELETQGHHQQKGEKRSHGISSTDRGGNAAGADKTISAGRGWEA